MVETRVDTAALTDFALCPDSTGHRRVQDVSFDVRYLDMLGFVIVAT